MGTFTHLRSDSPEKLALWEKYKEEVRSLLTELNDQVFDGEKVIEENHKVWVTPELLTPNLTLTDTEIDGIFDDIRSFIGVGVAHEKGEILRVTWRIRRGFHWHNDIRPDELIAQISKAAKYILDHQ